MKKALLLFTMVFCMILCLATVAGAVTDDSLALSYDDRKDLSQLLDTDVQTVEITNEVVTSKKVGTDTADAHVLHYENGTLYAVGTGTATLTVDGTEYAVTVSPAKLSLFLITGHSIGAGQYGDATQSVASEPGQTYSSFTRASMPSAEGGLGWGADKRVGSTGGYSIDAFAKGATGTQGTGSALAYQWNQLTGEKVWVMNLAIGGSALNEWLPGVQGHHSQTYYQYKYESVLKHYVYAQNVVKNEIAAGHYTFGHQMMFYFSGANFSLTGYTNATHADMIRDYEIFWGGLKRDLAMDIDGDGDTETLEYMGIVPAYWPTNATFTLDKALNFYMIASEEYPDVFLATDTHQKWMTLEGIQAYFPEPNYDTQSKAVAKPVSLKHTAMGGTSDNSLLCYNDNVHLSQVAYNAIGLDMATRLVAKLDSTPDLVTEGQFRTVSNQDLASLTMGVGEVAVVVPYNRALNNGVTFEVSENLKFTDLGLEALAKGQGTVVMKNAEGTVLDTLTVDVAYDPHIHCICGGHAEGMTGHSCDETTQWIPWGDQDSEKTTMPTKSGNYFLVSDVNLSALNSVAAGVSVNLCLNGHTVTGSTTARIYYCVGNLNIGDCSEEDKQGQLICNANVNGVIYMDVSVSGTEMNIFGGTFRSSLEKVSKSGGILFIGNGVAGTTEVNIYGGTIQSTCSSYPGAGVYIMQGATVNMYGGTITGGSTTSNGGNIYAKDCRLNVYGGSITGGTAAKGAGIFVADGAQVTLSGGTVSANAETIRIAKTAATASAPSLLIQGSAKVDGTGVDLYVDKTHDTEDSAVAVGFSDLTDEVRVAASAPGAFASSDEGSAFKVISADAKYAVDYAGGELYLAAGAADVYSGGVLTGSYKTVAEAAAAAQECGGIVKLTRNVNEVATVAGDLWLDLNGFDLSGITVTGTVYGMDSVTNDYTSGDAGKLTLAGGTVAVDVKTTAAQAGAVRRYLAIKEDGSYSFHRFYFGISHISMNPDTAGIGYRATFAGSAAVKNYLDAAAGFGLVASASGIPADLEDGVAAAFASNEFAEEGQTVTKRVLIQNILEENLSEEELAERGQTVISAVSFLQTKNGDVIFSSSQEHSLQAMFEALDVSYRTYDKANRKKLMTLYGKYESLMEGWVLPNLKEELGA